MNTFRFVLPLLAASLTASALAQVPSAVLLVQFGPGDIVLNKPLLDAIVNEPACIDAARKAAGDQVRSLRAITELPAPHAAGTFQIHLQVDMQGSWPEERSADIVDPLIAHLRTRLDQLLFAQPQEQAKARSAELSRKLEELLMRRSSLQASLDAATAASSDLAQRRAAYDQQIAAARLDLLTQERAREQVDVLRAQYAELREQRRAEVAKLLADKTAQEQAANQLSLEARRQHLERDGDEAAKHRAKVDDLSAAVRLLTARLDAATADMADAQRMLTVVLEQLPAGALEQQRAQARLDALAETKKQLEDLGASAAKASDAAAQRATEGERLAIEIAVTKTLLTEVEGKLARLQPVRYELLRGR